MFVYLFIFVFISINLGGGSERILLWFMSKSILSMFSSKTFRVSGLIFKSLIHFIFVYGVRKCSNFILLHVAVQFSQHHLLKRLSFLHCISLRPLSKIRCPYVRGFISGLSILFHWSIFLSLCQDHSLDDCGFVVEPEVRQVDSSSSILLSQDSFGYSRFLYFHSNCEIICCSSVKKSLVAW